MTVRSEIVTDRRNRLPQSKQCFTSGWKMRLTVWLNTFFFRIGFPCSFFLCALPFYFITLGCTGLLPPRFEKPWGRTADVFCDQVHAAVARSKRRGRLAIVDGYCIVVRSTGFRRNSA